jgi:hypothetical protein
VPHDAERIRGTLGGVRTDQREPRAIVAGDRLARTPGDLVVAVLAVAAEPLHVRIGVAAGTPSCRELRHGAAVVVAHEAPGLRVGAGQRDTGAGGVIDSAISPRFAIRILPNI